MLATDRDQLPAAREKRPTDRDQLLNWIKSQPELTFLRKKANETRLIYDKKTDEITNRIKVYKEPTYKPNENKLGKLFELIWVPGRKLRGKAYGDTNFDMQLTQTSSIMSLSTVWDFICTYPVIYYFAKASGTLVLPISSLYAFLLLGMSNAAGKFAMNRSKDNNKTASFLLAVFFLLSLVKTLMSGVGIDLISQSRSIKDQAALNFLETKELNQKEPQQAYKDLLISSNKECERLASEQAKLDTSKRGQRRLYREFQEQMNKMPIVETKLEPKYLIDNYVTDLGSCTKKDLINSFIGKSALEDNKTLDAKNNLRNSLSPLSYSYVFHRSQYHNLFKGNPLAGSESNLEKYKEIFNGSNIDFKIDCLKSDNECKGEVRWTNPGKAINEASTQFYKKIKNKEFDKLGFSFIGFVISILLSMTAVVLLFSASLNLKIRASRSNYIQALRNQIFTEMKDSNN